MLLFVVAVVISVLAQCELTRSCDVGWTPLGDKCYFVSSLGIRLSWQAARSRCMDDGGDLASITSDEEQAFIRQLTQQSGNVWIGLNQLDDRTTYKWSDGHQTGYYSWVAEQPINDQQHLCTYSTATPPLSSFIRVVGYNTVYNLTSPTCPSCVFDSQNTFYFGYNPSGADWCEQQCAGRAGCYTYTYFSMSHPSITWTGECLGRTNSVNVNVSDEYATSGYAVPVTNGTWMTDNCGRQNRFVCKKTNGASGPVTVPPTATVPGYCPASYYPAGNKCLKVVRGDEENQLTYAQALEHCRSQPGLMPDLASINSQEENDVVVSQMRDIEGGMWLGMSLWGSDWLWADNSQVAFTNWKPGEPSSDYVEHCVEMVTYPVGYWNNAPCDGVSGYVCQTYKDASDVISTPPPTPFQCPPGYVAYWYACYRLVNNPVTWSEAELTCLNDGAHLVSIHSEPENTAIFLYADDTLPKWIGLKRNSTDAEFVWVDGWPDVYTNWGSAEPSNDDCVVMTTDKTWDAVKCNATHGFICKISTVAAPTTPPPTNGSCPNNWESWGADCYAFPTSASDYVTSWSAASARCHTRAGGSLASNLVSIHSEAENRFIYDNLISRELPDGRAWIGLRQDTVDGPFYWVDGTPVQYTRWADGEPNYEPPGYLQCGHVYVDLWPGHWNDDVCDYFENYFYVCKMSKESVPQTPPPGTGYCPSTEWRVYGEWCFLFRPDERVDWDTAWLACEREGGEGSTLTSIRDNNENIFVWTTLQEVAQYPTSESSYIGLYEREAGAEHQWMDGTPVNYTAWGSGEPNGDESEHCVEMMHSSGRWNDIECTILTGYVCRVHQAAQTTQENSSPTIPSKSFKEIEEKYSRFLDKREKHLD